jgi:hypothetical protein
MDTIHIPFWSKHIGPTLFYQPIPSVLCQLDHHLSDATTPTLTFLPNPGVLGLQGPIVCLPPLRHKTCILHVHKLSPPSTISEVTNLGIPWLPLCYSVYNVPKNVWYEQHDPILPTPPVVPLSKASPNPALKTSPSGPAPSFKT